MRLNPTAVLFWAICAGTGYLLGDVRGAVAGVTAALALSFLAQLCSKD